METYYNRRIIAYHGGKGWRVWRRIIIGELLRTMVVKDGGS